MYPMSAMPSRTASNVWVALATGRGRILQTTRPSVTDLISSHSGPRVVGIGCPGAAQEVTLSVTWAIAGEARSNAPNAIRSFFKASSIYLTVEQREHVSGQRAAS